VSVLRARLLIALGALAACAPQAASPTETRTAAASAPDVTGPGNLDILFVIANGSAMAPIQTKLTEQIPLFMNMIGALPMGMPNVHVAVISSDLGAPGDSESSLGCTQEGDRGLFQVAPRGPCTDTTLASGATFISNVNGNVNFGAPDMSEVLQCIVPLGDTGCGFQRPLASIARALGADGTRAPLANAGFLRPDAMLAIVILGNEDDCSALLPNTAIYSLNSGMQNLTNSLGPLAHYRCNEFGHLCLDPHGDPTALIQPPETHPSDAQGPASAPTLELTDCQSNDSDGLLVPVRDLVNGIRALKHDPDHQIVVSAIVAPAAPYAVAWVPPVGGENTKPAELWPQVEHSCGPAGAPGVNPQATDTTTDGTYGDPAVRIAQWAQGLGPNVSMASICKPSYLDALVGVVNLIAANVPLVTIGEDAGANSSSDGSSNGSSSGSSSGSTSTGNSGGRLTGTGGGRGDGLRAGGCDVGGSAPGIAGFGPLLCLALCLVRRARERS
jgi:hypothetical protein